MYTNLAILSNAVV